MKVALIGATGLVGKTVISMLDRLQYPELLPVASTRSLGKSILYKNRETPVMTVEQALEQEPGLAIFSAGSEVSKKYASLFADQGTYVIDNSSAWRMDPDIKLIVPEINGHLLQKDDYLIANPNCSTIQLLMVLHPLTRLFEIQRVIVSTYQSVSGSGYKGINQLMQEREGRQAENPVYPYPIDLNCIPQCDVFLENDYTKEEMKLLNESRKILNMPSLALSATAVRIPVIGGHSESVYIESNKPIRTEEVIETLQDSPGVSIMDDPEYLRYPMPALAYNKDEVFVGRIRRDLHNTHGLHLWIVADNLRKGAATNAVQIAQMINRDFISKA